MLTAGGIHWEDPLQSHRRLVQVETKNPRPRGDTVLTQAAKMGNDSPRGLITKSNKIVTNP